MTDEERTKALRLARAIASDISLYNEQKIIKGVEQDNLFDVLKEELDEGRDLYRSRVSPEVYTTTNFFDRAVVDIIVRGKAHVRSKICERRQPPGLAMERAGSRRKLAASSDLTPVVDSVREGDGAVGASDETR